MVMAKGWVIVESLFWPGVLIPYWSDGMVRRLLHCEAHKIFYFNNGNKEYRSVLDKVAVAWRAETVMPSCAR